MKLSEAVKTLFLSYSDSLHRFVYQKLGNSADADEIVQDTFHNFLRIEDQEEIKNPQAFLYKTAHNLALNHIRKRGYRNAHLETLDPNPETIPLERVVISQIDIVHLRKRIHLLPEQTRKVFLMNRIDGMTYPEISDKLGVSQSSVQKHMIKALNYLRKHLERY